MIAVVYDARGRVQIYCLKNKGEKAEKSYEGR